MRDCSRNESPRIDNSEVNARFWVLRRDIRGRDTRRELPLSKIIPSLQTSISFQETVAAAAPGVDGKTSDPRPRHANPKSQKGSRYRK